MIQFLKYSGLFIIGSGVAIIVYNQWTEKPLPTDSPIDKIVVEKSKRRMTVFSQGKFLKTYKIALGTNPVGHKQFEGDEKTPEGSYTINDKNPNSAYHLNLGISYPNEHDRDFARQMGKSPGRAIKIHGLRNGLGYIGKLHCLTDWTQGCIALTNQEIRELYDHVPVGTTIEIKK